MKLFTPDGVEVVAILLNDGSASSFEFYASIKHGETGALYKLPAGNTSKLAANDGDRILIDSNGKHWLASDIEYYNADKF